MSGAIEAMDTAPLNSDASFTNHDSMFALFTREDLDKLVMDYLFVEGFQDVCEEFKRESGVHTTVHVDNMKDRVTIRNNIISGHIEQSMSLIQQLYPDLLLNNPALHFKMQKQHLIELIRSQRVEEALTFAQTDLADLGRHDAEALTELEQVMALLAFHNPEDSPFSHLLLHAQRHKLASEMNEAILIAENQKADNGLVKLFKLLHWVQNEMDERKVQYRRLINIGTGEFEADP